MKKSNGFSLMEMMVVLLIVAVVAAASAPMINKKVVGVASEKSPWVWVGSTKSIAYNLLGSNEQTAAIGRMPSTSAISSIRPRLLIDTNRSDNNSTYIPQITFSAAGRNPMHLISANNSIWFSSRTTDFPNVSNSVNLGYNSNTLSKDSVTIGADSISTAENSVAIGHGAISRTANTIAIGKSANGHGNDALALGYLTEAASNSIALGYNATAANENIAIGKFAQATRTQGGTSYQHASIAIGRDTRASADEAIAIGCDALASQASAIAIGTRAYHSHISSDGRGSSGSGHGGTHATAATGGGSIAMGDGPVASGDKAIAIGAGAVANNISAIAVGNISEAVSSRAIAIGDNAKARSNRTISIGNSAYTYFNDSLAIGNSANCNGHSSIAIGSNAKVRNCSHNSIAIGYNAISSHSYSTALGANARTTTSSQVVLGSANDIVYIPGKLVVDGMAVLGYAQGASKAGKTYATVIRSIRDGGIMEVLDRDGSGDWDAVAADNHNRVNYSWASGCKSDRRLKNVGKAFTAGLEEIKKLELFHYTFKNDPNKTPRVGVMAQDLQKIFPNAVFKGDDGFLRIRIEDMFYALINAVRENDKRITALEKENKELKARLEKIEKQLNK